MRDSWYSRLYKLVRACTGTRKRKVLSLPSLLSLGQKKESTPNINQTKFYNYEQESNSFLPYAGSYMEGPARPSINQYLCSQMEATTRYSPDYLWICFQRDVQSGIDSFFSLPFRYLCARIARNQPIANVHNLLITHHSQFITNYTFPHYEPKKQNH